MPGGDERLRRWDHVGLPGETEKFWALGSCPAWQTWPRPTLLVNSTSVEQRSRIRRLKAREPEYIPLVKLTRMALKADRRDLTTSI
jgi:hypothetical protein